IHSEPGLGTSVRIYLPAVDAPGERLTAPMLTRETPGGEETVLIVEDDPFVRGHAVSTLDQLGYRTLVAADGREAIAMLRGGARPDLLFTDIVMPGGMTGLDLADQARKLTPGIKVLFTSGYPLESLTGRAKIPANVGLLNKPYRMAELARLVRDKLDEPEEP